MEKEVDQLTAIKKAVEIFGTQAAFAEAMGTTQGTVSFWLRAGKIGANKALPCHRATRGRVSAHDLRPDIYPADSVVIKRTTRSA